MTTTSIETMTLLIEATVPMTMLIAKYHGDDGAGDKLINMIVPVVTVVTKRCRRRCE